MLTLKQASFSHVLLRKRAPPSVRPVPPLWAKALPGAQLGPLQFHCLVDHFEQEQRQENVAFRYKGRINTRVRLQLGTEGGTLDGESAERPSTCSMP